MLSFGGLQFGDFLEDLIDLGPCELLPLALLLLVLVGDAVEAALVYFPWFQLSFEDFSGGAFAVEKLEDVGVLLELVLGVLV